MHVKCAGGHPLVLNKGAVSFYHCDEQRNSLLCHQQSPGTDVAGKECNWQERGVPLIVIVQRKLE